MQSQIPAGWRKATSHSLVHLGTGWKLAMTMHSGVASFDLWQPPAGDDAQGLL